MQPTKLELAMESLEKAEETKSAVLMPEVAADVFADDIKVTAKILLDSMKKKATGRYELEPDELAKLVKSVCDLQNTFYPISKAEGNGTVIMTSQLSMFKGML